MRIAQKLAAGIAGLALAALPTATLGATAAHATPSQSWQQSSNSNYIFESGGGDYLEDNIGTYTALDITYHSSGSYGYNSPYWCIDDGTYFAGDDYGKVAQGPTSCGEYEQWWFQCSGIDGVTVESVAEAYQDGATGLNGNQNTHPDAYVDVGGSAGSGLWYVIVDGVGVWLITNECGY